jgi:hypothetical protein
LGTALLVAVCGCHSCERDRIESELHARELELSQLRDELVCSNAHNQALQLELRALHGEGCAAGPVPGGPPPPVYPIRCVALGRQTGGHPADCGPGDDALQVQVEPRDPEGHAVKVPGSALLVQAVEINPEGLKHPLSTWEVPPQELCYTWRSGLLSTGYSLTLPWKVWPTSDKLRVVAQLRLPDGRLFEADKDVCIRVAPVVHRPPPGTSGPAPTPAPAATPVLPPPRPVTPTPAQGPVLAPATSLWHAPEPEPAVELLRPVGVGGSR